MVTISSLKTSMILKFVTILQNLIKAYHRKSGKSKYDRKLNELDSGTTRIRSRVNGDIVHRILKIKSRPVEHSFSRNVKNSRVNPGVKRPGFQLTSAICQYKTTQQNILNIFEVKFYRAL